MNPQRANISSQLHQTTCRKTLVVHTVTAVIKADVTFINVTICTLI